MADKLLYTGTTHVAGGPKGHARSTSGKLDLPLPQPHPAAEELFAAAWSACFIAATQVAASQRNVKLTGAPEMDTTIDLLQGDSGFYLRAKLNIHVPGVEGDEARGLIEAAHAICPYSKATAGNIEVELNLI
ncbi:MAG: Ohr family peroxiredoxin [Sphingopyxis sp.]|nr:Ohr family peroxiredoxin [Sphingopyxis sp.]